MLKKFPISSGELAEFSLRNVRALLRNVLQEHCGRKKLDTGLSGLRCVPSAFFIPSKMRSPQLLTDIPQKFALMKATGLGFSGESCEQPFQWNGKGVVNRSPQLHRFLWEVGTVPISDLYKKYNNESRDSEPHSIRHLFLRRTVSQENPNHGATTCAQSQTRSGGSFYAAA